MQLIYKTNYINNSVKFITMCSLKDLKAVIWRIFNVNYWHFKKICDALNYFKFIVPVKLNI